VAAADPTLSVVFAHRTTFEIFQYAKVPGFRFNVVANGTMPSNQVYTWLANPNEWDIGEVAFSTYFMTHDLGSDHIALPIFPSRMVPHAGLWLHESSGIDTPRDLVGRRVGCNSFGTNYSVWARGVLAHQYDVATQRITWVQSVAEHRRDFQLPARFTIEVLPGNERSEKLLAEGRIDAASMASGAGGPRSRGVRPLFADPLNELRAYVAACETIPINTVLTVRRAVVERYPELPRLLLDAFSAARARQRATAPNEEDAIFEPLERVLGRSLIGYGFAANQRAIHEMVAYCYEQGITRRLYDPEALFLLTDS
jgi:4,5-dihydroxyphthalate decarboxylase